MSVITLKVNRAELEELLRVCEEAADGDSNDAEIDASLALQDAIRGYLYLHDGVLTCKHDGAISQPFTEGKVVMTPEELQIALDAYREAGYDDEELSAAIDLSIAVEDILKNYPWR